MSVSNEYSNIQNQFINSNINIEIHLPYWDAKARSMPRIEIFEKLSKWLMFALTDLKAEYLTFFANLLLKELGVSFDSSDFKTIDGKDRCCYTYIPHSNSLYVFIVEKRKNLNIIVENLIKEVSDHSLPVEVVIYNYGSDVDSNFKNYYQHHKAEGPLPYISELTLKISEFNSSEIIQTILSFLINSSGTSECFAFLYRHAYQILPFLDQDDDGPDLAAEKLKANMDPNAKDSIPLETVRQELENIYKNYFASYQTAGNERQVFTNVFKRVYSVSASDPTYWLRMKREHIDIFQSSFGTLLEIYMKLPACGELAVEDIQNIIRFIDDRPFELEGESQIVFLTFTLKFLKRVLFEFPELYKQKVFEIFIEKTYIIDPDFWNYIFIDIFIKHHLQKVHLPEKILSKFTQIALSENNKFGDIFKYFLHSEQEARRLKNRKALFNEIQEKILKSRSGYRCVLYLNAYWHLSFLLKDTTKTVSSGLELAMLCHSIPTETVIKSNLLLSRYLHSCLTLFNVNQNKKYLDKFEHIFLRYRHLLNEHQIIKNQATYAFILYNLIQKPALDKSQLLPSKFLAFITYRSPFNEFHLLYNLSSQYISPFEDISAHERPYAAITKVGLWLQRYLENIFDFYIQNQIKSNCFSALEFMYINEIEGLKQQFQQTIFNSLKSLYKTGIEWPLSSCCKLFSLFRILPLKWLDINTLHYLEKVTLAPNDLVIQASSDVYNFFYRVYSYPHQSQILYSEVLPYKLKLDMRLENLGYSENYYKLYNVGINIKRGSQDLEFLNNLNGFIDKNYKFSLCESESFLELPITDIINFCKQKQDTAHIIIDNIINSEMWNFLGTILANKYDQLSESASLHLACSNFYSIAIFFSTENIGLKQKYCFNYIHSKSKYYFLDNIQDEGFILDCLDYLRKESNNKFSFAEDRTTILFDLIDRDINWYSKETIEKIKFLMNRPEKIQSRRNFIWQNFKNYNNIAELLL